MPEQRVQAFVTDEPEEVARGATDDAAALMRSDKRATVLFAVGESPIGVPASYLRTIPGVRVSADRAAWEGVAPAA